MSLTVLQYRGAPSTSGSAEAVCPQGSTLVGGGCNAWAPTPSYCNSPTCEVPGALISNYPDAANNRWVCVTNTAHQLMARALCSSSFVPTIVSGLVCWMGEYMELSLAKAFGVVVRFCALLLPLRGRL